MIHFSIKNIRVSYFLIFLFTLYSCNESIIKEDEVSNNSTKSSTTNISYKTEADFYAETPTSTNGLYQNFVTDYGGNSTDFNVDDTSTLQLAIDSLSNKGGGRLAIPPGSYTFANVFLKSNVHLRINKDAEIRPPASITNGYAIFKVTNNSSSAPIQNVSIIGVGGKFKVNLCHTTNKNVRVIQSWNVKNFKYSDMLVIDNKTTFASIEFNGVQINNQVYGPRFGVVKNIDVDNAHYGYGVVQLQLGREIYFENLYGLGGTTLRIETHNPTLYDASKFAQPHNLYGVNIRSKNGNCAVLLSPHFVTCGYVNIDGVTSEDSGFAVRVEKGYVTNDEANEALPIILSNGKFGSASIINNVTAKYTNGNNAQIKHKHFKYMPCNLRPTIANYDGTAGNTYETYIYTGKFIAGALVDYSVYSIQFTENDISIANPEISTGQYKYFEIGVDSTFSCN